MEGCRCGGVSGGESQELTGYVSVLNMVIFLLVLVFIYLMRVGFVL